MQYSYTIIIRRRGQIHDNVNRWTPENNKPFNVDKCTHLNFGKNRFSFNFNNEQIAHVDCQKDLGLIVSMI